MAWRTFFEWPGQMLSMWLERWHGNIVVVGKNQAMKMMLEKAEADVLPYPNGTEYEKVSDLMRDDPIIERWHPKPEDVMLTCQRPPSGWFCTRKAGHEGPCAAHMVTIDMGKIEERVLAQYTDFKTFKEAYGEAGSEQQGKQAQESAREEEPAGAGSVPAPEAGTAGD